MKYYSTRGKNEKLSAFEAIKKGIASDGGLFIPESIPTVSEKEIASMQSMNYPERCAYILSKFIEADECSYDELLSDCKKAYKDFTPEPAPLKKVEDNLYVLELWHGPTCAFKDMALRIMPYLLSRAISKSGDKNDALILTATSGDTGKAALEGYRDVDRIKIMVFYPENGVSDIQKLQMRTQEGDNVSVCAIRGNFDDAQSGVKRIFADKNMEKALSDKGYFLTSANSINWGRLAPQIAYYFSLCSDIMKDKGCSCTIDVTVPTGNFGNILAAYIAKLMGAPIGKLICASNSNDVLTVFLNTGVYDRNRDFYTTISPSMDILLSSNLERLLALVSSCEECAEYMTALAKDGKYTVKAETMAKIQSAFEGLSCTEDDCAKTIESTFENYKYLIDPHTAVAMYCADKKRASAPMAVVSTASAFKFAPAVNQSLKINEGDDCARALAEYTGEPIPSPIAALASKKVRFSNVVDKEDMDKAVLEFVSK